MNARDSQRNAAFTLIELIFGLAMSALLAFSLYASLRTAYMTRDAVTDAVEMARAAELPLDMIEAQLESALPPGGVMTGAFLGQPSQQASTDGTVLEFYVSSRSSPQSYLRAEGIQRISLALVNIPGDELPSLVRRTITNLLSPTIPVPLEEILCRNVLAFEVSFYDSTLSTWMPTWDSTTMENALPVAVQLNLAIAGKASRKGTKLVHRSSRLCLLRTMLGTIAAGTGAGAGTTKGGGG